jgi:hypothetical protein
MTKKSNLFAMTRADIAILADRLNGHARVFPRTSERRDIMLAANLLRTIVAVGFLVDRLVVPIELDDKARERS